MLRSEGGAIDGFETYGAAGFAIDGAMIAVAWVSADLEIDLENHVERPADSAGVSVRPSDFLNPADGYIDGTTATIVTNARTDRGRFVVVTFPANERPPTIQFSPIVDSAGTTKEATAFELTPTVASPFDV